MKLLVLTEVSTEVNDKGQKRIENALSEKPKNNGNKDKYGYTRGQWEDIGTPIPEDSIHYNKQQEDNEIDDEGYIKLNEDELKFVYYDTIVSLEHFVRASDLDDFGSLVYLKDGNIIRVEEDTNEIYFQIELLTETRIDKLINWLKEKLRSKKHDLKL